MTRDNTFPLNYPATVKALLKRKDLSTPSINSGGKHKTRGKIKLIRNAWLIIVGKQVYALIKEKILFKYNRF